MGYGLPVTFSTTFQAALDVYFFIGLFYEANIRALIEQIPKVWFSQPSSQPLKD